METVCELLDVIRKRPGMYIGKRCPIRLHLFLQGWSLGKGTVRDLEVLRGFQMWVARRYNISSSHSWAEIIVFYSECNVEAFKKFYELFDEFNSCREISSLLSKIAFRSRDC